ncbi:MogA/MoaB family molybdenum cofactor biosynthesis protein [Streptomyces odontomachi]|uniref:MogA/MoaB family molybdenum cofactor biosynthesis protein n=1 Tax=Streptomyces odontomachi TaxID=2944940 RepID=UPI0035A8C778
MTPTHPGDPARPAQTPTPTGHGSNAGHGSHVGHERHGGLPQDDPRGAGRALVVTASNRAAAGVYADTTGPVIAERLVELGFAADGPTVVPDGAPVERALRDGVTAGYDVIVTTGGTGISPTDRTPEATRRVIDYEVPGIAEAIRAFGRQKVPTASLSRGLAGVADRTLIVNLPGSTGGVKDGLAVLTDLLPHAVAQLRGVDHPRPGGAH